MNPRLLYPRGCPATLLCLMLCILIPDHSSAAERRVLTFSSYATERPSEEFRKMEPFRQAVEQGMRDRGEDVKVDVRIFPTYEEGMNAIIEGKVDFARVGPVNYVLSIGQNPGLTLIAAESHQGRNRFSGLIITTKISSIHSLHELRGKRFAFGDPSSTTGRYLPQAELVKAGIYAKDLADYAYLGRHDKVVFAVASGNYDAGATNERTYDKYTHELGLRELARFPSPTQAWIARAGLDPGLVQVLRDTLFSLQGPALDYIDRNGFLPAKDSDFDELRSLMKTAHRFGD